MISNELIAILAIIVGSILLHLVMQAWFRPGRPIAPELPPDLLPIETAEPREDPLERLESALRESRERNQAIMETALDCIVMIDHEGRIVEFNAAAERTFGYGRAQAIGKLMVELLIPPEWRKPHEKGFARYLSTGEARVLNRRLEMTALRADGSTFPVELTVTRAPTANPPIFTGYLREITRQKTAERRRQARLAVTQALAQAVTTTAALPNVLAAIGNNVGWQAGVLWSVDRGAQRLRCVEVWHDPALDIAEFESLTREMTFALNVGLPGKVWASARPAWSEDLSLDKAFPRVEAAIRVGLHSGFGFPIFSEGNVVGVIEFFNAEIHEPDADLLETAQAIGAQLGQMLERRRAEESIQFLVAASNELASLADRQSTAERLARLTVPALCDWCVVYLVREDRSIERAAVVHVDPEKERLLSELRTKHTLDWNSASPVIETLRSGKREVQAIVTDALLTSAASSPEHLDLLRSLHPRSQLVVPLNIRGKTIGALGLMISESDRKYTAADATVAEELARRAAVAIENAELYQQLREADQRKDEFLAMLSHELRNPLAPMRSALELLSARADQETLEWARQLMQRQVKHIVRLVDDLLDVSRIMRGKVQLRKESVDVLAAANQAIEEARPVIDSQEQQLSVSLPPEPVWVDADPTRLAQIISNLLTNAAKYTDKGGRLSLTVQPNGKEVAIHVRDTGMGIAPEMLSKIFDLFTQVDQSLDRSRGGLGIGLALVRSLVELHQGTVSAYSAGLGHGSEFVVRLPTIAAKPTDRPARFQPTEVAARRVLVVDDNHAAADAIGKLMAMVWGHEVKLAHNGHDALELAQQFQPQLILMDIGLPGMNGYEVAERLRARPEFHHTLLVALTGYAQEEDRQRSLSKGFDEHLVKPVSIEDLQDLFAREKVATES